MFAGLPTSTAQRGPGAFHHMSTDQASAADKPKLKDFGFNRHSQFGEDGVIERIFGVLGTRSKVCVEFGAWDGFHLSNTAHLWTHGWKGVLIEGDPKRFRELTVNVAAHDCVCIEAWVARDGPGCLEALLRQHGLGAEVDLLSIDIDGDDYYILESLQELRPRVIICEYNPTIPADVDLVASYGNYFGASVAALERLARTKGYRLVALTDTNCFFVQEQDFPAFSGYETRLERIRIDSQLVHVITDYRGDYVLSRPGSYGYGYPYRGGLTGPHVRAVFKSPLARPAGTAWRRLKQLALELFR